MYRLDSINCTKLPNNRPVWHITCSEGTGRSHSFQRTVTFKMSDILFHSAVVSWYIPVVLEEVCHHLLSWCSLR